MTDGQRGRRENANLWPRHDRWTANTRANPRQRCLTAKSRRRRSAAARQRHQADAGRGFARKDPAEKRLRQAARTAQVATHKAARAAEVSTHMRSAAGGLGAPAPTGGLQLSPDGSRPAESNATGASSISAIGTPARRRADISHATNTTVGRSSPLMRHRRPSQRTRARRPTPVPRRSPPAQ